MHNIYYHCFEVLELEMIVIFQFMYFNIFPYDYFFKKETRQSLQAGWPGFIDWLVSY